MHKALCALPGVEEVVVLVHTEKKALILSDTPSLMLIPMLKLAMEQAIKMALAEARKDPEGTIKALEDFLGIGPDCRPVDWPEQPLH